MSERFDYEGLPMRIIFGAGRLAEVGDETERLEAERVVVVATGGDDSPAGRVRHDLGERWAGQIDRIQPHVPEEVAVAARERFAALNGDALVALGGGSTVGLAKAVALTTGCPVIAVPTTYAGSEMTPIWGLTTDGHKATGTDSRVLPRTVVYDPELTLSLPPALSASSGMNALAHCAEALWVPSANPVTSSLAEEGIRALAGALPRIVQAPVDADARAAALRGAALAGMSLAAVGGGLHHKLAHVLGGTFDLPHAEVHATLLPYTTAFHSELHRAAMARIARVLEADDAPGGLWDLGRALGLAPDLAVLGLDAEGAARTARIVADSGQWKENSVREVLDRALNGARP